MIPYEDLVIALQTWRAKQGLPVAQLSGALTPPPVVAAPPSPSGPSGPPAPPPKQAFLGNVATPPPLAAPPEDSLDVEDEALLEDPHLEPEGDDFAMAFGAAGHAPESEGESDDATAIGAVPAGRPSDHTLDDGGTEVASPSGQLRSNIRNDDW